MYYDYGFTGLLNNILAPQGDTILENEACLELRQMTCPDPRDFVIVLDRSGSMKAKNKWTGAIAQARYFTTGLLVP